MKKLLVALLAALAMFSLSGCFPVFIPVHDGYYGHHHDGYRRGW